MSKCGHGNSNCDACARLQDAAMRAELTDLSQLRAELKVAREALAGLISNIQAHQDGECPGITPADCLDAIYGSASIALVALAAITSRDTETKP